MCCDFSRSIVGLKNEDDRLTSRLCVNDSEAGASEKDQLLLNCGLVRGCLPRDQLTFETGTIAKQ